MSIQRVTLAVDYHVVLGNFLALVVGDLLVGVIVHLLVSGSKLVPFDTHDAAMQEHITLIGIFATTMMVWVKGGGAHK